MSRARPGTRVPSGWVLGHVAGAPVVLAPSWLLVAVLLTWVFLPVVQRSAPDLGAAATVVAAAAFPVLLAASVLLHEIGHGLTGRRFGAPPSEYVITLWGGHTQFERDLPGPAVSALVSIAGPAANGLLALVSWWAAHAAAGVVGLLLWAAAVSNGFVAVFNVLPGLPLDGGRVLEAVVWRATGERASGTIAAGWTGRALAVAVAVVWVGWPLLQGSQPTPISAITVLLVSGFLWAGATSALRSARGARSAASIDLLRLARPAVSVHAGSTVADVEGALAAGVAVVLVSADQRPVAIASPAAVAELPAAIRDRTGLEAVLVPLGAASVVSEHRGLAAVRAMAEAQHAGPVAVLVDSPVPPARVLGVVSAADVAAALRRAG